MKHMHFLVALAVAFALGCGGGDSGGGNGNGENGGNGDGDNGGGPVAKGKGTITGVVLFEGTAPPQKELSIPEPKCNEHRTGKALSERVIVTDGKLQNVLVYVKRVRGRFKAPDKPFILDQKGCVYRPHIIAIMKGQAILVRNRDKLSHNVHFLPEINPETNISQDAGKEDKVMMKLPEIGGHIKCDVHPWMGAKLHVLKHPFFQVTGKDGKFTLKDVPAGEYTLAAWHEKYGEKTFKVKVDDKKETKKDFTFSE